MTTELAAADLAALLTAVREGDDDTAASILARMTAGERHTVAVLGQALVDLAEDVASDWRDLAGWQDGVLLLCGCPPWVEELDPTHDTWTCAATRREGQR